MIRFELAARPTVSLLKLDSEQIVDFGEFTVLDASLAAIIRKMESDFTIEWNRVLDFETCARWGNVFQNRPLGPKSAGLQLPLNPDQIGTKFSLFVFFSFGLHNYSIGISQQWFRRIS
jgi:hypothetical protein